MPQIFQCPSPILKHTRPGLPYQIMTPMKVMGWRNLKSLTGPMERQEQQQVRVMVTMIQAFGMMDLPTVPEVQVKVLAGVRVMLMAREQVPVEEQVPAVPEKARVLVVL